MSSRKQEKNIYKSSMSEHQNTN